MLIYKYGVENKMLKPPYTNSYQNTSSKSTYISHLRDFASPSSSEFTSDDVDSFSFGSCSGSVSGLGVSTNVDGCGCDGSGWGDTSGVILLSSISPECANNLNKMKTAIQPIQKNL